MELHVDNMREGLIKVRDAVLKEGELVPSRNGPTIEVRPFTLIVDNPRDSLPLGIGRRLARKIAALEALQLLGAFSNVQLALHIAPQLQAFLDQGRFHGAYGPRIAPHVTQLVELLTRDPETRQGVITIYDSARDLWAARSPKDIPCTLSLHFIARHRALELHTYMRSNDVFWGLTYDAFQFTQLQLSVAMLAGFPHVGRYVHHATSMHIYEKDLEPLQDLTEPAPGLVWDTAYFNPLAHHEHVHTFQDRCRALALGQRQPKTDVERWYVEALYGAD